MTLPWSYVIVYVRAAMPTSLVASWLAYSSTWFKGVVVASVRLVTTALYSAVAWERLENASYILTRLLDT